MIDASRMRSVIALLVATLIITAWMAMRAQYAEKHRREAAEGVVRDWTRVAADEIARRAEAQTTFYGTYTMLQKIAAAPQLPRAAELMAAAKTPLEQRNARLVVETFRHDSTGTWWSDGLSARRQFRRAESPPLHDALDAILADPPPPDAQTPIHIGERVFVYALSEDKKSVRGFEVNREAVAPFFELAMTMRPLLPRSLANGRIGNDKIHARAIDSHGRTLFATRVRPEPYIAVRHPADADGLLRGVTVEASIARDTVHLLVAGGIPRSIPIYLLLLTITVVLLAMAIVQIGRERALARMRSDFVASVSHELRTPLTQIRMFAETLQLDRIRSDAERARSLAIIDQESRRLAQLVENVLQFSRGERGLLKITPRVSDVGVIVRAAVDAFAPIAAARQMRVTTNIARDATASVDDDAMRQVLLNLLDNAAKYGPDGQEIAVDVRRIADSIRISVDDEGPGIPPRDRKRIWHRYRRLARERERAIAGAGIGLAVVRDIVRLHHGKTWCESGARGGARFVIDLPLESRS